MFPVRAPQWTPPAAGRRALRFRLGWAYVTVTVTHASESKSDCQSTRAAGGLTCQLQFDNWGLGRVSSEGAAEADAGSQPVSGERFAFDSNGPP